MNIIFWRNAPDHSLSAVFRELAQYRNCEVAVVCIHDIAPHRKKMGWRIPDFGKAKLIILPEKGWTAQVDRIINNNLNSLHIPTPFLRNAKMRYVLHKIIANDCKYGMMSEIQVNQEEGLKWIPREIYLHLILKPTLWWLLRKSLFILSIESKLNGYTYFKRLVKSPGQVFPFGYFPESPQVAQVEKINQRKLASAPVAIIYLGMLIPRKGIDLLFKALAKLKIYKFNFRCHIVGGGPYQQDLEKLSVSLGLQDAVQFHGPLPYNEVRSLLRQGDILVTPGRKLEPWGMPVNEGIQAGLAVVVSDSIGGGSDLARASGAGLVFSSGEVDSLTGCLYKYLSKPVELAKAKKRAENFTAKISPQVAAKYLFEIIKYALGEIPGRPVAPWLQSEENFE